MRIDGVERRAVWWEGTPGDDGAVCMLDQRRIPFAIETVRAHTVAEVAQAVRTMVVRGAPTIGATAAYGMVLAGDDVQAAADVLAASRPTARDLFAAIDHMTDGPGPSLARAEAYVEDVVERCRLIGVHGAALLASLAADRGVDPVRALTHCHAGALATVDHGTALAPFHHLAGSAERAVRTFVWVDETRPRMQGAITAWELTAAGVENTVLVDNASGAKMAAGEVDVVIVGADRVAANGDVANKIGTYTKAVLAHENGVPFYVAIPCTTYDPGVPDGAAIPIESRGHDEVLEVQGHAVYAAGTRVENQAFDVTPARYVTGYITELGVLTAAELPRLAEARDVAVTSGQNGSPSAPSRNR